MYLADADILEMKIQEGLAKLRLWKSRAFWMVKGFSRM